MKFRQRSNYNVNIRFNVGKNWIHSKASSAAVYGPRKRDKQNQLSIINAFVSCLDTVLKWMIYITSYMKFMKTIAIIIKFIVYPSVCYFFWKHIAYFLIRFMLKILFWKLQIDRKPPKSYPTKFLSNVIKHIINLITRILCDLVTKTINNILNNN